MTERAVVVGRDGRAKAYRPLPATERAAALEAGLAAYERGDFFEAHELLEPAWMGTPDLPERAAAPGPHQGGRRVRPRCAREPGRHHPEPDRGPSIARGGSDDRPCGQRRASRPAGARGRHRRAARRPCRPPLWADARPARLAKERPVSMSAPVPTIDVTEAERRLRDDPAPLLLDVREMNEFLEVRAPGAALMPTSAFMTRVGELPADRPIMVVCHVGGRSAAVAGYLHPCRARGRRERRGRDGRVGEGGPAGPPRPARAGRGRSVGWVTRLAWDVPSAAARGGGRVRSGPSSAPCGRTRHRPGSAG